MATDYPVRTTHDAVLSAAYMVRLCVILTYEPCKCNTPLYERDFVDSIYGSYKISTKVLYKMISASSMHHGRYAGASKYEIDAMIYLTHLADSSGFVEDFRTSEFIRGIGCSRREAYSLIHSLEDKGYISLTASDWKCCRGIKILDNDFSHYNKSDRYLDTNHGFFIKGGVGYQEFKELSLTATRLLLYLMYNYSAGYGYHASYSSVQTALGIKGRRAINRCLSEIESLFPFDDTFYSVREDLKRGLKYGFIDIASNLRGFLPQKGIPSGQESYFKRHMLHLTREAGCEAYGVNESEERLLSRLFAIFKEYGSNKLDKICELFKTRLVIDGCFDELTLYHLNEDLRLSPI